MKQNWRKCSKMEENEVKLVKMRQNRRKCSEIGENGAKSVKKTAKSAEMKLNGAKFKRMKQTRGKREQN